MKDLSLKLKECINIREQLHNMRVFIIEENSKKYKKACNEFIRDNQESKIKLYLPSIAIIEVQLSNKTQSGCYLVR